MSAKNRGDRPSASDPWRSVAESEEPELRIARVFDAPKRMVYEAWTKAEHVERWFTPAPLTTSRCEVDLRPGGVFRVWMRTPAGTDYPMDATFREVVENERIIYDAVVHGELRVLTTVTFVEHDGRTRLEAHQVYSRLPDDQRTEGLDWSGPSIPVDDTRGAQQGWTLTLNQLEAHVRAHM